MPSVLQGHPTHPSHHHTFCPFQTSQIISLHCPSFSSINQNTLDTNTIDPSFDTIRCTTHSQNRRKLLKLGPSTSHSSSSRLHHTSTVRYEMSDTWSHIYIFTFLLRKLRNGLVINKVTKIPDYKCQIYYEFSKIINKYEITNSGVINPTWHLSILWYKKLRLEISGLHIFMSQNAFADVILSAYKWILQFKSKLKSSWLQVISFHKNLSLN